MTENNNIPKFMNSESFMSDKNYVNVSSTNSACDKTYLKEADDFAMMLTPVNFIANKVINLSDYGLLIYQLIGY